MKKILTIICFIFQSWLCAQNEILVKDDVTLILKWALVIEMKMNIHGRWQSNSFRIRREAVRDWNIMVDLSFNNHRRLIDIYNHGASFMSQMFGDSRRNRLHTDNGFVFNEKTPGYLN